MTRTLDQDLAASTQAIALNAKQASADAWQQRFGVPWERVERAVRAVSDRAVAASRRRFADLDTAARLSDVHPG